ncbi:uncharacterized protein LOC120141742 isoform X2 [Hibiscus syriacus]|uniref:uncharacterized protein LOC120141742 isoform X2 n=1 Tax=Hibiscus syriacus TaxID=106335 RepID=UPI001921C667|nr:uncharacterized protein LOC120141742 isoform X2 [Hibiscus syriacus]
MAKPRKLFSCCSLLMAIMFGLSSSVQLNDPDWYFWFPLYSCACIVNLLNWRISPKGSIKHIAKVALCLGVVLFLKNRTITSQERRGKMGKLLHMEWQA